MNKFIGSFGAIAGALCLTASATNASVSSETKSAQTAFAGVAPAELPAQAASFVSHKSGQTDAAVGAMKAAIALNSYSAASVLASIVKAAPTTAPDVTVAAVSLLPKQRFALAKIAAKTAPSQAVEIAKALAKFIPRDASEFAVNIASTVPVGDANTLAALDSIATTSSGATIRASLATLAIQPPPATGPFVNDGNNSTALHESNENPETSRGYAHP